MSIASSETVAKPGDLDPDPKRIPDLADNAEKMSGPQAWLRKRVLPSVRENIVPTVREKIVPVVVIVLVIERLLDRLSYGTECEKCSRYEKLKGKPNCC
jgi:hypothetical protein